MRTAIVLLTFALACPAPAAEPDRLPGVLSVEQRLADEIAKMLQAGHLRPVYAGPIEHYYAAMEAKYGDIHQEYWHNPAETIYTLLRALPHVPAEMREPLRQYIQSEWAYAPPSQFTHMGFGGQQREWADIPPELKGWFTRNSRSRRGIHHRGFKGWTFKPFNFYACWKYAEQFGGAQEILAQIQDKIQPLPDTELLAQMPHVLNCYIAGYYGVLGLQKLAGQSPDPKVQAWLDAALAQRAELLKADPRQYTGAEAGTFMYLVPELGQYLHEHARADLDKFVHVQTQTVTPLWFLSRVDESTKLPIHTKFNEGSVSHYYDATIFNALSLAQRRGRAELEPYLDAPAVERGDLFHIQNLVSTIEAK